MKKSEFLAQLKNALENELSAQQVKENIDYYADYIKSEVEKGYSEEDVISQLGDPWAIAKTILLSNKINGQEQSYDSEVREQKTVQKNVVWSKWKAILIAIVIIAVLLWLLSAVFGVVAILVRLSIRFAFPILIVVIIISIFKNKK